MGGRGEKVKMGCIEKPKSAMLLSLDTAILVLRLSIRINQSEKLGKYKYSIEPNREYK